MSEHPLDSAAFVPITSGDIFDPELIGRRAITNHGEHVEIVGRAHDPARCTVRPLPTMDGAETFTPRIANLTFIDTSPLPPAIPAAKMLRQVRARRAAREAAALPVHGERYRRADGSCGCDLCRFGTSVNVAALLRYGD